MAELHSPEDNRPSASHSPQANGAVDGTAGPSNGSKRQPAIADTTLQAEDRLPAPVAAACDRPTADGSLPAPPLASGKAKRQQPSTELIIGLAVAILTLGLVIDNSWLSLSGTIVALLVSGRVVWLGSQAALQELLTPEQRLLTFGIAGLIAAGLGVLQLTGLGQRIGLWYSGLNWDAVGATGEVIGAVGQILIAILAVYVAWRQYVISKALTIQQNVITQQQTIDSYFQGISELVLDDEGLLEDLPLERSIAAGRTAAILSSVDANGKAKVIRFLSQSRLLTPLQRDARLGWAILDGAGGYAEDRDEGIRVIDLGVMLAGADLSGTDLRWTDLSDSNLIRADLSRCDLVKTNLARTILCGANLTGADLTGARLFYGSAKTATPRSQKEIPDYITGANTGAVVEGADFTETTLSEEQRYYCCAWSGAATRETIPGGCNGIPNLVGR